jgi:hypothetical protein
MQQAAQRAVQHNATDHTDFHTVQSFVTTHSYYFHLAFTEAMQPNFILAALRAARDVLLLCKVRFCCGLRF